MSSLQFGTLKYLIAHEITVEHLGIYNLTTLGSLIQRGWVERQGSKIAVTKDGQEAYDSYSRGGPNYRLKEGELSERVRLMLHINKLRTMPKAS